MVICMLNSLSAFSSLSSCLCFLIFNELCYNAEFPSVMEAVLQLLTRVILNIAAEHLVLRVHPHVGREYVVGIEASSQFILVDEGTD